MDLTSYSSFYTNLNRADPFEIRKNLDIKIDKIKKQEFQAFEKRLLNLSKNEMKYDQINKLFKEDQTILNNKNNSIEANINNNKSNSNKKVNQYHRRNKSHGAFKKNENFVIPEIRSKNFKNTFKHSQKDEKDMLNLSKTSNGFNYSPKIVEQNQFNKNSQNKLNQENYVGNLKYPIANKMGIQAQEEKQLKYKTDESYHIIRARDNNNKNLNTKNVNLARVNLIESYKSLIDNQDSLNNKKNNEQKLGISKGDNKQNAMNFHSPRLKTKMSNMNNAILARFQKMNQNNKWVSNLKLKTSAENEMKEENQTMEKNNSNPNYSDDLDGNHPDGSKKSSQMKIGFESCLNSHIRDEKDFKDKIPEFLFCLISEEDRIFDEYGQKYKEMHRGLELFKSLTRKKNNKNGTCQMDPIQRVLSKVYKSDQNFLNNLKQAKKQKILDLDNYQKNLVNTISKALTKDSIQKLCQTMRELKLEANKIRNPENKHFIRDIEDREFEIIKNLQKREEQLNKLRVVGRINQVQPIPSIKFKKLSKD